MPTRQPRTSVREHTVDADAADVARAAAGDAVAYERIYHRHAPRIYRLAHRFVGRDLAEDATQDVFVHAWSRLAQFRGDSEFATWLHRIAVNILVRQAATARRLASRIAADDVESVTSAGAAPGGSLDIDAAIARLSEELRAVVVLHDLDGYAHAEIAETLGISTSASKMRLHRGRMQLREWLLR